MKFGFSFCTTMIVFLLASVCNQAVYAQFGDDLGNYKADKALNMNAKNINNIGAAVYKSLNVADIAAGGAIGTAATTVDSYSLFIVNQTTAGKTLTLPTPTTATAGETVWVSNVGTADFTLYGVTVGIGKTVTLLYNGSAWSVLVCGGVVDKGSADGNTLRWSSASGKWVDSGILKDDGSNISITGNFAQSGATTLSTGTGGLDLRGDVTVATGKKLSFTGNTSYKPSLIAPSTGMVASYSLTLPTALPTAASFLNSATDGTLGWSQQAPLLLFNNIKAATTSNGGIDNGAYTQTWNWNALSTGLGLSLTANAITTGSLLSLSSTSTGQTTGSELLNISTSGSATAGIETKGINISNTNTKGTNYGLYAQTTGGSSTANYGVYAESSGASNTTNYGVYGKASGATTNYAVYAEGPSYFNGTLNAAGDILPTATNTKYLGSPSYVWSNVYATNFNGNATSATKLGAATVGSTSQPIYLNAGAPAAISSTVGSASNPIYLNAGVPTAITATVGSATTPIYLNAGVPTALTATVGNTYTPIYLNNGSFTALSATVGSASTPVYLSNGSFVPLTSTKGSSSAPVCMLGGAFMPLSTTVGSASTPVYMSGGSFTALSATVGSISTPAYMSNGTYTPLSANVGSASTPVYMSSGAFTALSSTVGGASTVPVYMTSGAFTANSRVKASIGGIGLTSYAIGDLLYAGASDGLSRLPADASGKVLVSKGTGTAPAWGNAINHLLFSADDPTTPSGSVTVKFNNNWHNSTQVTYDNSTGYFTLKANKRYKLRASLFCPFGKTTGGVEYKWRNITSGTDIGIYAFVKPGNTTLNENITSDAVAIIAPTADTNVAVMFRVATDASDIPGDDTSFVEITEF